MKIAEWIMVLPCYFVTPMLGTNLNTCVKSTLLYLHEAMVTVQIAECLLT